MKVIYFSPGANSGWGNTVTVVSKRARTTPTEVYEFPVLFSCVDDFGNEYIEGTYLESTSPEAFYEDREAGIVGAARPTGRFVEVEVVEKIEPDKNAPDYEERVMRFSDKYIYKKRWMKHLKKFFDDARYDNVVIDLVASNPSRRSVDLEGTHGGREINPLFQ